MLYYYAESLLQIILVNIAQRSSLVAQWVKDLALSLHSWGPCYGAGSCLAPESSNEGGAKKIKVHQKTMFSHTLAKTASIYLEIVSNLKGEECLLFTIV